MIKSNPYKQIKESCLSEDGSSSLLNATCVREVYDNTTLEVKTHLIPYLKCKVLKGDTTAYNAYAILASEEFISMFDIANNEQLKTEFKGIHNTQNTLEQSVMELNALHIQNSLSPISFVCECEQ